jgi:hypothetical protein
MRDCIVSFADDADADADADAEYGIQHKRPRNLFDLP